MGVNSISLGMRQNTQVRFYLILGTSRVVLPSKPKHSSESTSHSRYRTFFKSHTYFYLKNYVRLMQAEHTLGNKQVHEPTSKSENEY